MELTTQQVVEKCFSHYLRKNSLRSLGCGFFLQENKNHRMARSLLALFVEEESLLPGGRTNDLQPSTGDPAATWAPKKITVSPPYFG